MKYFYLFSIGLFVGVLIKLLYTRYMNRRK